VSLGPAALTASLPGVLGRQPCCELVIVGVSSMSPDAAVILSVDLADTLTESGTEEAAQTTVNAVALVQRDGATKVAVVVYAPDLSADSTAARLAATAVVCAEAAGLGVLDAIAVTDGRWRSYECTNPECCPPEGTPITGGPTP
jgi:hypothetical protein